MKKILIALDFNSCSQKTAETGFEYARTMNAEICIVHAIADIAYYPMEYSPLMGFEGFSPDGVFNSLEEQENEAERFLEAVTRHLGDINIKTKVLNGKIHEAILEYAVEYKADLIVMGVHSHSGLGKILGDVTARVIKHTDTPVLIIPPDKKDPGMTSKQQNISEMRKIFLKNLKLCQHETLFKIPVRRGKHV